MKIKHLIIFVIALTLAVVGTGLARRTLTQAQSAFGMLALSVSPPVTYMSLQPGDRTTHQITLKYEGSTPITIIPSLVEFQPADTGIGITLEDDHTFPYLDPNQPNPFEQPLTLEPDQQTSFRLPIAVPESAPTREYHLTVLFATTPTTDFLTQGVQTNVAGTIGSNLIILVSPDNRDLGQLSIKSVQGQKLVDSFSKIQLEVLVENTGPTATVASGSATLKNFRGETIKTFSIFPDVILANSVRQLRVFSSTETDPELEPSLGFEYDSPFLLGPYQFELQLENIDQQPRANITIQVWAVPLVLIVALLLALALIFGYLFVLKKIPIGKQVKTY